MTETLRTTPLHDRHLALGAKMGPFAQQRPRTRIHPSLVGEMSVCKAFDAYKCSTCRGRNGQRLFIGTGQDLNPKRQSSLTDFVTY